MTLVGYMDGHNGYMIVTQLFMFINMKKVTICHITNLIKECKHIDCESTLKFKKECNGAINP